MNLRNKRILITAGPTWVPLDSVRVISNIATGETGILLARKLAKLGAKVTLLLGPINPLFIPPLQKGGTGGFKAIRILRFIFFDEFKSIIIKELKTERYDIVIHSAAVSDYKPAKVYNLKVKSGIKSWSLELVPTKKIIDLFKKINPALFVVGFKFEPEAKKITIVKEARNLIQRAGIDLVVANTINRGKYEAFITSKEGISAAVFNKGTMVDRLMSALGSDA